MRNWVTVFSRSSQAMGRKIDKQNVADAVGSEIDELNFFAFGIREGEAYEKAKLKKRKGGYRPIRKPVPRLSEIQRKLANLLSDIYEPPPCTFGFVEGESIVENAKPHVSKKWVLCADLKGFFKQIHFGRVRGVLKTSKYGFTEDAAVAVANICTCSEGLPQGAPSSPIISNIVAYSLDQVLMTLANKSGTYYTRYADDITFSTDKRYFPEELAELEDGETFIGEEFSSIVESAGFELNREKCRLQPNSQRQIVTGLVVNDFVNVPEKLRKETRAMLYAWETHGEEAAEKELNNKYYSKHRAPFRDPSVNFRSVLRGKIEFIGDVRGKIDNLYLRRMGKFFELSGMPEKAEKIRNRLNPLESAIWLFQSKREVAGPEGKKFEKRINATAVMVEQLGVLTCEHCIGDEMKLRKPGENISIPVTVVHKDTDADIALLSPKKEAMPEPFKGVGLKFSAESLERGDVVHAAGFPKYKEGDEFSFESGNITRVSEGPDVHEILISPTVVSGHSGGPVLNDEFEVVGIITSGAENLEESLEVKRFAATKIDETRRLRPILKRNVF